jgi:hypothetical protein
MGARRKFIYPVKGNSDTTPRIRIQDLGKRPLLVDENGPRQGSFTPANWDTVMNFVVYPGDDPPSVDFINKDGRFETNVALHVIRHKNMQHGNTGYLLYFTCPMCDHPVRDLYKPNGKTLGCWICHSLRPTCEFTDGHPIARYLYRTKRLHEEYAKVKRVIHNGKETRPVKRVLTQMKRLKRLKSPRALIKAKKTASQSPKTPPPCPGT